MLHASSKCRRQNQWRTDKEAKTHHPDDRADAEDYNIGHALPHCLRRREHHQPQSGRARQSMCHTYTQGTHRQMHPVVMPMLFIFLMVMEMQMPFAFVLVCMEMPPFPIDRPGERTA